MSQQIMGSETTSTRVVNILFADGTVQSTAAAGGGGGTVTSFSSGNLSPLFTTSVATPTTTPALSFSLTPQANNVVLAGPTTGGPLAPTFRLLVAGDIPALPYLPSNTQLPQTTAAVAHQWLNSYNAGTGLFTQTQPSFTDLSGSIAIGQTPLTAAGDILYANGTPALSRLGIGTTGQVLTVAAGEPAWASPATSGTVTSVALSVPGIFSVSGSPITSSGTLAVTLTTESVNTVWAGPASGPAATPTFRALVAADIPSLPYLPSNTVLPATFAAVTNEWINSYSSTTGLFTATQPNFTNLAGSIALAQTPLTSKGDILYVNSAPALAKLAIGATGQVLTVAAGMPTWSAPAAPAWSSLTAAAANLTLANGAFTTTFDQTASTVWLWANTTVATPTTTNGSPSHQLAANYWSGSASAADTWAVGSSLALGTNGASTLSISHTGSTGLSYVSIATGLQVLGHMQAGPPGGTLNKDLAGQVTITAGNTTQALAFTTSFTGTGQPIVVITPTTDPIVAGVPLGTWVTYSGSAGAWTGFIINISATLVANVTFNYIVVGNV